MISKTEINKKMRRKTNPYLVDTIFLSKKSGNLELAKKLSVSTKQRITINLSQLNDIKEEKIIVPGKILGSGEINKNKKLNILALSYSKQAKEKLKKAGCEFRTIKEELEKNSNLSDYKIIQK
ncbi:MAG: uL15 family ribosomal protein [Candidatus Pacearchaeota archaeon]